MTITRRKLLKTSVVATGVKFVNDAQWTGMLRAQQAPAIVKGQGARPQAAQGVASGDVAHDRAIIWSRCDRPARMIVDWATTERMENATRVVGPTVIEATDFTGRMDLRGLPPGQRICYRVLFQDLRDLKNWSEPAAGTFVIPTTSESAPRDVTVAFTGDVCGQGWGIDPARGGLRLFETMLAAQPDLFIHLGDA